MENKTNEIDKFRLLSKNEKIRLYLNFLYGILKWFGYTKVLRKKRTVDLVRTSYNENPYRTFLQSECWATSKSLQEFALISYFPKLVGKNIPQNFLLNGKLYNAKAFDIAKCLSNYHTDIFKKFVLNQDEIVEIGCGIGTRLFSLRASGFSNKMEGYDLSQNGITACQEINDFFRCDMKFEVLDLTEDFDSNISWKDKTVFSFFCLEQLKHYTEKVVYNLLKAKPKQVLHFEPVKEMYNKSSFRDILSRAYNYANEYQDNLLITLKEFEKKGLLKITDVNRLGNGANPLNETCFIRWIPI